MNIMEAGMHELKLLLPHTVEVVQVVWKADSLRIVMNDAEKQKGVI